jgi:hypothetical protein
MVLVDEDAAVAGRIFNERVKLEELGTSAIHMDENVKQNIALRNPHRPEDSYREGVKGSFPAALFYTRYSLSSRSLSPTLS